MKNELSAALEPLVVQGSSGLKFRAKEGLKFLSNLKLETVIDTNTETEQPIHF